MGEQTKISLVNGPVVKASPMFNFQMREMVTIGGKKLIGEVVKLENGVGTVQVYEETEGLKIGDELMGTGKPLSVKLGPGLMGNMFDGIERPLDKMQAKGEGYIEEGIGLLSIELGKAWLVKFDASVGDYLESGHIYARIQETELIEHRLMVPEGIEGRVVSVEKNGRYALNDLVIKLEDDRGNVNELPLYQEWPVRKPRSVKERLLLSKPLITGQRVLDMFFPLAKGGTAAIPGGFGTGKTMTQHQLAKWSDADVIVYIGCGERGNEMTEVLEDFPRLIDPKTDRPLMDRTILIANTSNMPVAAREASIYTGITIAEYYRDMGYHVAIMADSTSRWAEALREISGRLEEMPAEEGYPAYLPSRLAEFYERAGYVITHQGSEGSITVIGAVSPAGGDFSEPVTENTKRFVNAFLALDKKLAYARHYPSINWLNSYSGYLKTLEPWYRENVSEDAFTLRAEMLSILYEENKLADIVQLVGEDVLPDNQRLVIEISKVIKEGFLQQNAFHEQDTFVPLPKQYLMLELIKYLYDKAKKAIDKGIPISLVKNEKLFEQVVRMKYNIPNDDLRGIGRLLSEIDIYYDALLAKYD
ncbi:MULTISPECIES: V-type ATP synthase subunit A [unclassified Fusibacter]|uniref:V-type ATP synthase subunit A n=1 Tax=unclassified Fusibacter TaxID=2624464 RepID=UPI0010126650|nr:MULTISPECIES: V-type ATP synthase subunit A [unclassified Fusibacter]MCK8059889.1 V-type ATP synthase subunit A [Fusibacter sp. A2]NPE21691.1 V-type ATP synthase subunit A [Fusibacter sp. A1]RXV62094.1 V-type ATP synthase subunit A [Fusibacter sp. A1]